MHSEEDPAMKAQERRSALEDRQKIQEQLDDKTNQSVRIYGARQSLAGAML